MTEDQTAQAWQYYYKRHDCKAEDAKASDCICWRSEGTGPFDNARHDDPEPFLEFRI